MSRWGRRGRWAGLIVSGLDEWMTRWMGINPTPVPINTPSSTTRPRGRFPCDNRLYPGLSAVLGSPLQLFTNIYSHMHAASCSRGIERVRLQLIRGVFSKKKKVYAIRLEQETGKYTYIVEGCIRACKVGVFGVFFTQFKSAPTSASWRSLKSFIKTCTLKLVHTLVGLALMLPLNHKVLSNCNMDSRVQALIYLKNIILCNYID